MEQEATYAVCRPNVGGVAYGRWVALPRGAGDWHRPGMDNFFFADVASFGEHCPPPLSRGVIDWRIPLAWGPDTAKAPGDAVGTIGTTYHQVFTLEASGSLRIDKFTQWIECSADGFVTHSSGIR